MHGSANYKFHNKAATIVFCIRGRDKFNLHFWVIPNNPNLKCQEGKKNMQQVVSYSKENYPWKNEVWGGGGGVSTTKSSHSFTIKPQSGVCSVSES